MKRLVDIGTKKIELYRYGSGKPVVVIETGMGCSVYDWNLIIKEISKRTTVIAYHRAGYGESTIGDEERTTKQITQELKQVLEKEEINEPVILVGHSFGGLCVQHFARMYPQKVKSIALLESTSVDNYKLDELALPGFNPKEMLEKATISWKMLSKKSEEEIKKEISISLLPKQLEFSAEMQQNILNFSVKPTLYKAMASENENMSSCGIAIKSEDSFPDVPLIVIVRDKDVAIESNIKNGFSKENAEKIEGLWQELVREQVKLSNNSKLIEAPKGNHRVYLSNPDLVVEAIGSLL